MKWLSPIIKALNKTLSPVIKALYKTQTTSNHKRCSHREQNDNNNQVQMIQPVWPSIPTSL